MRAFRSRSPGLKPPSLSAAGSPSPRAINESPARDRRSAVLRTPSSAPRCTSPFPNSPREADTVAAHASAETIKSMPNANIAQPACVEEAPTSASVTSSLIRVVSCAKPSSSSPALDHSWRAIARISSSVS